MNISTCDRALLAGKAEYAAQRLDEGAFASPIGANKGRDVWTKAHIRQFWAKRAKVLEVDRLNVHGNSMSMANLVARRRTTTRTALGRPVPLSLLGEALSRLLRRFAVEQEVVLAGGDLHRLAVMDLA